MGCDIHMHVEYKDNNKDQWICGDYLHQSCSDRVMPGYTFEEFFGDRNYSLFAILANVRNYGNTEYIDDPRGLPDDVSDFVKNAYEDWRLDAHSCSHLTLKELIDFHDQCHPLKRSGVISPEAQKLLESGILPDIWCQGTNRVGWERREWEEENDVLVPLICALKKRADELNLIPNFYWNSDSAMARGTAYEQSANIRIVFWFDN